MARRFILVLFWAFPIVFLAPGCGTPGAPAPPSLNLPTPVQDLSAVRIDAAVHLAWTMPTSTTDRVTLKRPVSVEICRKVEGAPCVAAATITVAPGKPGSYTEMLPGNLTHGANRLLTYQVFLRNHAQKSAGASNSAFTAAGAAPAALAGLTAQVRRDGVLLSWSPAAGMPSDGLQESMMFRIERTMLSTREDAAERTKRNPLAGPVAASAAAQTLAVRTAPGLDPGHALDTNAQLNQRYRYTVARVATITFSGHAVDLQGQPSDPVTIATTDIFPPAVPRGLAAVADAAAGAIDLSWTPDTDSDLAGYIVYRRNVQTALPYQRLTPLHGPIASPSFRDTKAERGHTYAYAVSAIDESGNESARSSKAMETLPNQ